MVAIVPLNAFDDNYIWAICDRENLTVVDPGQAEPVIEFLKNNPRLTLSAILVTHNHYDHVGGVNALVDLYHPKVFASWQSSLSMITQPVRDGMACDTGLGDMNLVALEVPGHTKDHIAFYDKKDHLLFCGDTLFGCGCGRIFDSTVEALYDSLQKLAQLPEDTKVYAAHEYTQSNIAFAKEIEPDSKVLAKREKEVIALRKEGKPTLPSLIKTERKTNPFLRVDIPSVIASVSRYAGQALQSPLSVFTALREWKNVA